MGKKSYNKRRGGGKRGGGGSGAGGPGLELMEVDPAPLTATVEMLARQREGLPSAVEKVRVPSLEAFVAAKKADEPEEALRALKIPDLRGIVSMNDEPRICAHCYVALRDSGILSAAEKLCSSCGIVVCEGCFADHKRVCGAGRHLAALQLRAGAAWALYHNALRREYEHLAVPMLRMAADAGHPDACHFLSTGYVSHEPTGIAFLDKLPTDIVSAAKYAERALVLDPDTYIGRCAYTLKTYLSSLVKDGMMHEASKMAALLAELDYEVGNLMLPCIELSTFGPFYDQTRLNQVIGITPSTTLSVDFLSQRDMSPEEIRLADYEAGDGILRMLCATLKGLSVELLAGGSSCPLRAGLANFIDSTLYLMAQTANLGFFRSIPTLICKVANEVAEAKGPDSLLNCDSLLLLMLTNVAAKSRMGEIVTCLYYDRESHAMTTAIANNANLPAHIRGLALVIQADMFCQVPYSDEKLGSSNKPKETIIRRRARALSLSADIQPSCPLESLTSRLLDESGERLATMEGESRHSALKRIADIRTNAEPPDYLVSRLQIDAIIDKFRCTVGGSGCDHCGTSLLEAKMPNLLKCGRCCQAHFCSEECASLAFDSWHHGKSCRKVCTFSIGEIVSAKGFDLDVKSTRTRRGAHAEITGKTADGKFEVKSLDASEDGTCETDVIESKNLYHRRSLH